MTDLYIAQARLEDLTGFGSYYYYYSYDKVLVGFVDSKSNLIESNLIWLDYDGIELNWIKVESQISKWEWVSVVQCNAVLF